MQSLQRVPPEGAYEGQKQQSSNGKAQRPAARVSQRRAQQVRHHIATEQKTHRERLWPIGPTHTSLAMRENDVGVVGGMGWAWAGPGLGALGLLSREDDISEERGQKSFSPLTATAVNPTQGDVRRCIIAGTKLHATCFGNIKESVELLGESGSILNSKHRSKGAQFKKLCIVTQGATVNDGARQRGRVTRDLLRSSNGGEVLDKGNVSPMGPQKLEQRARQTWHPEPPELEQPSGMLDKEDACPRTSPSGRPLILFLSLQGMFLTLLLPLLVLLEPWGLRGPWGRPVLALGAVVPPSWADPRHNPCASQPGGWQLLLWPADGRCYRIFRRGHPCPPSMELTPGVGPGGAPGCRCPPGLALRGAATKGAGAQCHPLLEQGPCPQGQYLAPLPPPAASEDRVPDLRGACRAPDPCPVGHVFWPRDGRCYPRLSRGPCYRGELLVAVNASRTAAGAPLGACRCEPRGDLARFYSPLTKTCHEHYTPGPCQEKGLLFLPAGPGGGQCGCSPDLPHYHSATGQCYQIDTIGPCPAGHRFSTHGGRKAQCRCKGGHVPWPRPSATPEGGSAEAEACYRPWTRGPCPAGQLLSDESECVSAPCRPGRLYFPEDKNCYKVGVRGPCPKGQVVLFETAVRPALEGISYRGMCGCTGPNAASRFRDVEFRADRSPLK
ncbi:hypothetical protein FOCC_FOCC000607 [Frankliniella occidentalis]|nr:hypothetical protein FOCC_FOCC000607 [Frankliniella occidentalis]